MIKLLTAGVLSVGLLSAGLTMSQSPTDPNRPDCPGQIRCPQTGEWVCKDRCPELEDEEAKKREETSCPLCP
jgi:hypothetical protein